MKFSFFAEFIFVIILSVPCVSQEMEGLWSGEIQITEKNSVTYFPVAFDLKYNHASKTYYGINRTVSFGNIAASFSITGYFDSSKNAIYLEEKEILETNYKRKDSVVKNYYYLKPGTKGKFTGEVFCFNPQLTSLCKGDLFIKLKRKK